MSKSFTIRDLPKEERPRERLVEAGKILGIEVTDHIVVAGNRFLSFKEKGLL